MKILFVYSNKTCGCTKKYTFELARGMKKYVNTKVIYYTELTSDYFAKTRNYYYY